MPDTIYDMFQLVANDFPVRTKGHRSDMIQLQMYDVASSLALLTLFVYHYRMHFNRIQARTNQRGVLSVDAKISMS